MAVNPVSTYTLFQSTLGNVATVQNDLADLQNQLSSGQKSQNFQGLGSQATQYLDLQNKIATSEQYVNNNTLAANTLDVTNNSLTQVLKTVQDLTSQLSTHLNPATSNGSDFSLALKNIWQSLTSSLNATSNGKYVFSGSRTDTQAVNTQSFPTIQDEGVPDDSYYQGSSQDLTIQTQDGVVMAYNVRANDPAFQQIFAGLAMAQRSINPDGSIDTAKITNAYDLVQQGTQGVITLQSSVNNNKLTLTTTNTNLQSLQTYWKGLQQSIGNTDLVSVSTQVAVDQGILQAAFQAFAKINSLNLANFLPNG